jgi:hypothetical protein
MTTMVASSRKSGMPRRRARTDAWTSPPSDTRLLRSTDAVSAIGAETPAARLRFTNSPPCDVGERRWLRSRPSAPLRRRRPDQLSRVWRCASRCAPCRASRSLGREACRARALCEEVS